MPEYSELEKEIINHYKRSYLSSAMNVGKEEFYRHIVEHSYGKGARDPLLIINWGKVLNENQCPQDGGLLSLSGLGYICASCGLSVPIEVFDKAFAEHKEKIQLLQDEDVIKQKIRDARLSEQRVGDLYEAGVEEASVEYAARKKSEEAAKGESARKVGLDLRKPGATDEIR
jgi:hypothetical protein